MTADLTYHIVSDVHGNVEQFEMLLRELGYTQPDPIGDDCRWDPPPGCRLICLGDLADRGPDSLRCLLIVKRMVERGSARLVMGNHDWRFRGMLRDALGLHEKRSKTPASRVVGRLQILAMTDEEKRDMLAFLDATPPYIIDEAQQLIFVHGRWETAFTRLEGRRLYKACAFGRNADGVKDAVNEDAVEGPARDAPPTTADPSAHSPLVDIDPGTALPSRARWARDWSGPETVFWGHQVMVRGGVARIGKTINVESGCFEGHALSAYIHPEGRVVQVWGSRHWRVVLREYEPVHDILFPTELEPVRQLIEREGLDSAQEYVTWLQIQCEDAGTPPPFASVERAHARLFERCLEASASPGC